MSTSLNQTLLNQIDWEIMYFFKNNVNLFFPSPPKDCWNL